MKAASLPSNMMASITLNSNTSGVSKVKSVVDTKILELRNPKKALPIYRSGLQNEASHRCIVVSWYNLPSPSLPTSGCLQPLLPLLHPFHLHSTPTLKHACATYTTASHPPSD